LAGFDLITVGRFSGDRREKRRARSGVLDRVFERLQ
jgi:hypothetical protein